MKTRTYSIIDTHLGEGYFIGRIEGPATPALSTLLKRFKKEYGIGPEETSKSNDWLERKLRSIAAGIAAESRLEEEGYGSGRWPEQFVEWVIRNHGFQWIKDDRFYVH